MGADEDFALEDLPRIVGVAWITDDNSGIHECAKCHHKWLPNLRWNPMTTPRDALRALELEIRAQAETSRPDYYDGWVYEVATGWADCLAATLSQMDCEPTVAQWREAMRPYFPPHFEEYELDKIEQRARTRSQGQAAMSESESSPAGCERCGELDKIVAAERTIAEATEHCQAVDEENFHLKRRAESAERTCEELKAKCGELFAREQVLKDEMLRARTAVQS